MSNTSWLIFYCACNVFIPGVGPLKKLQQNEWLEKECPKPPRTTTLFGTLLKWICKHWKHGGTTAILWLTEIISSSSVDSVMPRPFMCSTHPDWFSFTKSWSFHEAVTIEVNAEKSQWRQTFHRYVRHSDQRALPLLDVLPNVNSSAGRASIFVPANTAVMFQWLADSCRRERWRRAPSTGSCSSPRTYPPLHQ